MSEKVILKDFTVLSVCPSEKWSSIERRAIFDCTFLRNIGGNPVLMCFEGSQISKEAEQEDIPQIYIKKRKLSPYKDFNFIFEFRNLLKENRYDIIHCYDLSSLWISAFFMKRKQETPLFLTFSQNINTVYHNIVARWLLKRVDNIFTLSKEIQEFVKESFYISSLKVKNLGSGLEVARSENKIKKPENLGCIIDNINELKRLRSLIKVFRFLKNDENESFNDIKLSIFLGPRIYQKDEAKNFLAELDYEFYEGDIFLYSLENKRELLKDIHILLGVAFDEPLNDYEITSLINQVPVIFPRTAMRQSLIFKYSQIGESYYDGDMREIKDKIKKVLLNYSKYQKALKKCSDEVYSIHGIEDYADSLQLSYESGYAKRHRFIKKNLKQ